MPRNKKDQNKNKVRNALLGVAGVGALGGAALLLSKKGKGIAKSVGSSSVPDFKPSPRPKLKPLNIKKVDVDLTRPRSAPASSPALNVPSRADLVKAIKQKKSAITKSKASGYRKKVKEANDGFLSVVKGKDGKVSTKGLSREAKSKVVKLRVKAIREYGGAKNLPIVNKKIKATKDPGEINYLRGAKRSRGVDYDMTASSMRKQGRYFSRY